MKDQTKIVLIDDDKLIHLSWNFAAKKQNIDLFTFFTIEEFLKDKEQFELNCSIYIDSNLGADILGEIESEKLFNHGFKNLYIATGYSSEHITKPHWIKEIISKSPPF